LKSYSDNATTQGIKEGEKHVLTESVLDKKEEKNKTISFIDIKTAYHLFKKGNVVELRLTAHNKRRL
jgi:hypothetical protein